MSLKYLTEPLNFRNFYRYIVPGGGTGGVTMFTAEQLRHTNAEIVYLDFSTASMKIAQRRARARKLENIVWVHSWIEGARFLGLGLFNDFSCSGVLHHLKSPVYGLNVLKDQLTTDGGMYIMVYGQYGRSGVYQIQELMKYINTNLHEIQKEIKNTDLTISDLPKRNWFMKKPMNINDHKHGDIGLYDLCLHKRDVAYSMKTLFQWLQNCGLHFIDLDSIKRKYTLKLRHQTDFGQTMKRSLSRLDLSQQLHITEIFKGSLIKQDFYASKIKSSEANLFDPSNVLYTYGNPRNLRKSILDGKSIKIVANQTVFEAKVTLINVNQRLESIARKDWHHSGKDIIPLTYERNEFSHFLIEQVSHSNRGVKLKDVWSEYKKKFNTSVSDENLIKLSKDFYDSVKDTGMLLLKKRHVNPFPMTCFMSYYMISPY